MKFRLLSGVIIMTFHLVFGRRGSIASGKTTLDVQRDRRLAGVGLGSL